MTLRVEIRGLDRVRSLVGRLGDVSERLANPIGDEVERQVERRIDTEKSAPSGGRWAAFSPQYRRSGRARELLQRSGALLSSIRSVMTPSGVEVGSDLPYAARQNARRPFLGLSRENETALRAIIEREVAQIVEAA